MARKNILWLCSWYPNKIEPFNGDFIKRHAEAVSLYEDVQVIYVVRDFKGDVTKDVLVEESNNGGLNEKVIYYYSRPTGISIIDKYLSEKMYRQLFKQSINSYINESGAPVLTHVHVGMKAGVIAKWLKRKKMIPYVISEHWTGILQEANEKITKQSFYFRTLWKKVTKNASGISAVSEYLGDAIRAHFFIKNQIRIIPNTVDTNIFFHTAVDPNPPRFIHISSLSPFKNPRSIIEAFYIVRNLYPSAVLEIFGPENKPLMELTSAMGIQKSINFHLEKPQSILAKFINKSIALILYSSYETFGCVIIEANACGIPVIVSDIPVFYETVKEGVNGVFVRKNNTTELAEAMITMIEKRVEFDSVIISQQTISKYNYATVGKQFSLWYNEIIVKD